MAALTIAGDVSRETSAAIHKFFVLTKEKVKSFTLDGS